MGTFAAGLVTGGASGIGLAVARQLSSEGSRVAIVDRDEVAGRRAAGELGVTFLGADVSDPAALRACVEEAARVLGALELVHLNAGIDARQPDPLGLDEVTYRAVMGVNVDHVVFGSIAAARHMPEGGAVVVTASLAGLIPMSSDPLYTLSKHAVVGWVRSSASAFAERGIRLTCVCPGFVDTPLLTGEARRRLTEVGFPLLAPEEVAAAVLTAATSGRPGEVFVCQPGRAPEPYHFRGVPGPRAPGAEGAAPPDLRKGRAG